MGYRGVDDFTSERLHTIAEGLQVSDDVLGVVRRIQEYDENLLVKYLDPSQADFVDAPWRIMERCPDGHERVVMEVWQLDMSVLQRLYALDTQKFNTLEVLDRNNRAVKLGEQRRYKEETDALSEMVRGILRSPKDTYTAVNPVTGQEHKFTSLKRS